MTNWRTNHKTRKRFPLPGSHDEFFEESKHDLKTRGRVVLETRTDPVTGIIDELMEIPISEVQANPNEDFELHEKLGLVKPRKSGLPIEVFGKRSEGDSYQIIDGHRRVMEAKSEGKEWIKAWVTKVDSSGKPVRTVTA